MKLSYINSPIKQFLWAFLVIHILGIGLNAILYFLNISSGLEKLINNDPLYITLAGVCYLVFNIMLYVIIKIKFLLSNK